MPPRRLALDGARVTTPAATRLRPVSIPALARGEDAERDLLLPFRCLVFFTFVLFVSPQSMVPALEPLRLAKVSAGLAIAAYVIDRLSQGRSLTVRAPAVTLVLAFLAMAVLSVPFSRWPGGSVELLLNEFSKSVAIFFLLANTVTTVARMRLMIGSMALWGILMAVTAVRDFASGNLALKGTRIAGYDSPLAANPNDLALTLCLILALAIGLFQATRATVARLLLLGAIGVCVAGVIASFSRAGFLTLIAIVLVLTAKRVSEKGPAAVAPLLALLLIGPSVLPQGYADRIYSIFDFSQDATGSATARSDGMKLSLNLMIENPLVGVGLGQDVLGWLEKGGGWGKTHNAFLQVGADLGIPAFVVYLLLMWYALKAARQPQKRLKAVAGGDELLALGVGLEIAVVAYVVGACFAPVPYHFYFFYVAGFIVAYQEIARRFLARHEAATPLTRPAPAAAREYRRDRDR